MWRRQDQRRKGSDLERFHVLALITFLMCLRHILTRNAVACGCGLHWRGPHYFLLQRQCEIISAITFSQKS